MGVGVPGRVAVNNLRLVLGGPGCGKTTRLLDIVAEEMGNGVPASAIAFVTFTKAAAEEAKERAAIKFGLNPKTDMPWFRTIHSLAYAKLALSKDEVMAPRDWKEFGTIVGEPMSGWYEATEGAGGGQLIGDSMLRVIDYASTTLRTLKDAWNDLDEFVEWNRLVRFADALRLYKEDSDKMDFNDMLQFYLANGAPVDVAVAVVDEAQDLTAAQWAVVRKAFANVERIYIAGDDDQAIYSWAGADVTQFLHLTHTPEVLPVSHRLPKVVHKYANRIAGRISERYAKTFASSERDGSIDWHQRIDSVDITSGTWFLLARNTYMLARLEAYARDLGVNYSRRAGPAVAPGDVAAMQLWERLRTGKREDMSAMEARGLRKALDLPTMQMKELTRYTRESLNIPIGLWNEPWYVALTGFSASARDYYLACLRRGEKLTKEPRVRIETIHGVKGAEAENVLLMSDLSNRTAKSYRLMPDNEHRVFYVGLTRALQSVHIVMPQTDLFYPLT